MSGWNPYSSFMFIAFLTWEAQTTSFMIKKLIHVFLLARLKIKFRWFFWVHMPPKNPSNLFFNSKTHFDIYPKMYTEDPWRVMYGSCLESCFVIINLSLLIFYPYCIFFDLYNWCYYIMFPHESNLNCEWGLPTPNAPMGNTWFETQMRHF
jgi:hypothetical protein